MLLNDFNIQDFKYILFFRVDFFIKKYFFEIFNFSYKLIYAHFDLHNLPDFDLNEEDNLVCENIILIPDKYFEHLGIIWITGHYSFRTMVPIIGRDNIDFLFIHQIGLLLHWVGILYIHKLVDLNLMNIMY